MRTVTNEFWSLVGRYYDPSTDQFISVDPDVAETGQPYAYTGDDPLNSTDPLGLKGFHKRNAGRAVSALCLLCGAAGAYIGAGTKGRDKPEQPQDPVSVVAPGPKRPEKPIYKLPPSKMVNVTPSAELGPTQPIPQIPASQLGNIASGGYSVEFHVPPLTAPPVELTGVAVFAVIAIAAALSPVGA